ncbi:plastocyanin/azurin family copper-binding protein [Spongiimicrobium salis]|uniref:plastocyanin/azurin family copper-binding protein n=1 Tax=Spongiimicrobium salis TaxID=1667022 RepID=UPI00374CD08F
MKKLIVLAVMIFGFSLTASAQDKMMKKEATTVSLAQVKGNFVQQSLTLAEGNYIFEIANDGVGHDVGFVLMKKGADASNAANHIKTAYVTKAVATGEKQTSNPTKLEKGEYVYFCPLNPTPQYTLIVK